MSNAHPHNGFSPRAPHCPDPDLEAHDHDREYAGVIRNLIGIGIHNRDILHRLFEDWMSGDPHAEAVVEDIHKMGADTALLEHFYLLPPCTFPTSAYDYEGAREFAFGPGGREGPPPHHFDRHGNYIGPQQAGHPGGHPGGHQGRHGSAHPQQGHPGGHQGRRAHGGGHPGTNERAPQRYAYTQTEEQAALGEQARAAQRRGPTHSRSRSRHGGPRGRNQAYYESEDEDGDD